MQKLSGKREERSVLVLEADDLVLRLEEGSGSRSELGVAVFVVLDRLLLAPEADVFAVGIRSTKDSQT